MVDIEVNCIRTWKWACLCLSCWLYGGLTYFSQELSCLWVFLLLSVLPVYHWALNSLTVVFCCLVFRVEANHTRDFISIPSSSSACLNHTQGSPQDPSLLPAVDISCLLLSTRLLGLGGGALSSCSNLSLPLSLAVLGSQVYGFLSAPVRPLHDRKSLPLFVVDFGRERVYYRTPSGSKLLLRLGWDPMSEMMSYPSSTVENLSYIFFQAIMLSPGMLLQRHQCVPQLESLLSFPQEVDIFCFYPSSRSNYSLSVPWVTKICYPLPGTYEFVSDESVYKLSKYVLCVLCCLFLYSRLAPVAQKPIRTKFKF